MAPVMVLLPDGLVHMMLDEPHAVDEHGHATQPGIVWCERYFHWHDSPYAPSNYYKAVAVDAAPNCIECIVEHRFF